MSFLDDMNKYLINDLSKIVGSYLNPSRSEMDDMPGIMSHPFVISGREYYKARADNYNYFKCIRTDKPKRIGKNKLKNKNI